MESDSISKQIESVVRESYGKILALLVSQGVDLPACEDALSEALASALKTWPETGLPENPQGWIFKAARNRILNHIKYLRLRRSTSDFMSLLQSEREESEIQKSLDLFEDYRLRMLFTCAHPAIDEADRTVLMLQVVLGLDANSIASAFLLSPSATAKRLVRAKEKIKRAGIPFQVPEPHELGSRLDDVLQAIYALYSRAYDQCYDVGQLTGELSSEAQYLAELTAKLLPTEAEPKALIALICFCEARRSARVDKAGIHVPLDQQETSLWNKSLISRAELFLHEASRIKSFKRFQIEAAIQSAHVARVLHQQNTWGDILILYQGLLENAPSLGAQVSYCGALMEAKGPGIAKQQLDRIAGEKVLNYQPYWIVKAEIAIRLNCVEEGILLLRKALGLSDEPSVRRFISKRIAELEA